MARSTSWGAAAANLVAFIEVKARASLDDAAYAVTPRQQARIIAAARPGYGASRTRPNSSSVSTPC